MTDKKAATGQCLCGAVRFTAGSVDRQSPGACHCKMCQRWSGGIFISATANDVSFDGESDLATYRSSKWAERGFCKKCGSHLFYRFIDADEYEFCIGAFDNLDDFVLTKEIFIDRKPDTYALAGDHSRVTEAETLAEYKEFGG